MSILALVFMLVAIFIAILIAIHKEPWKEKPIEILYGYPAYSNTWLTVKYCRQTARYEFDWDEVFDSGRPISWGDVSQCLMLEYKSGGASQDEIDGAWKLLKKRGLA
ncbi:hypothetical protein [Cedecea sp.]|jgi:hypothetical protein|uniref:hypothetical protein n=1 Tax=Cedecea sp. TaxID=1970739 RepID=UPI002F4287F8